MLKMNGGKKKLSVFPKEKVGSREHHCQGLRHADEQRWQYVPLGRQGGSVDSSVLSPVG